MFEEADSVLDDTTENLDDAAATIEGLADGKLEEVLAQGLGDVGVAFDPESLSCSADVGLSTGAAIECDLTKDGQPIRAIAEVTGLEGTAIQFDIRTEPQPIPAEVLAETLANSASQQLGGLDVSATCEDELSAAVDAAVSCTLAASGAEEQVDVVVDALDGGQIQWRTEGA